MLTVQGLIDYLSSLKDKSQPVAIPLVNNKFYKDPSVQSFNILNENTAFIEKYNKNIELNRRRNNGEDVDLNEIPPYFLKSATKRGKNNAETYKYKKNADRYGLKCVAAIDVYRTKDCIVVTPYI